MKNSPRPSTAFTCLVLILTLLAGCASNRATEQERDSARRKAAEANTSLGLEYMNRGQYEVALGKLKKAVAEDPDYAPGHTVLAVLYEQIGEMDMAGKHYNRAIKADPGNGDVNNNYGVYLCNTNDSNAAMGYFESALEDPFYNSPEVALTNAGSCAMGAGRYQQADGYLRRALSLNPEFPDALSALAQLNFQTEDFLRARAFLQRYEAIGPLTVENTFLGFQIESALRSARGIRKYATILNSEFSESEQAARARSMSES